MPEKALPKVPGPSRVDGGIAAGCWDEGMDQVDAWDPLGDAEQLGGAHEERADPGQGQVLV